MIQILKHTQTQLVIKQTPVATIIQGIVIACISTFIVWGLASAAIKNQNYSSLPFLYPIAFISAMFSFYLIFLKESYGISAFNKKDGILFLRRSKLIWTQKTNYKLSEIAAVDVSFHVIESTQERLCNIYLALQSGERIPLTTGKIGELKAQKINDIICEFMNISGTTFPEQNNVSLGVIRAILHVIGSTRNGG